MFVKMNMIGMVFIKYLESVSNSLVKDIKKLKNKSTRYEKKLFVVEGESVVEELVTSCPENICYVLFTQKYTDSPIIKKLEYFENLICVSDHVFESISDTKTPQGILSVAKMIDKTCNVSNLDLIVYLDNVSDPGNVGTIIRTCDAANVDAVILSPQCADIYNSKTVRSTMGSLFHIPVFYENKYLELIDNLICDGFNIFAGCLDGKTSHFNADFTNKSVICLGNEAHGISDELADKVNMKIKIPIPGKAESLNVSIAGAILVYEALRQRGTSYE